MYVLKPPSLILLARESFKRIQENVKNNSNGVGLINIYLAGKTCVHVFNKILVR